MLRVFLRGILILILPTFVSIEIQLFTILDHKAVCVQTFLKRFNFSKKEKSVRLFQYFNRFDDINLDLL